MSHDSESAGLFGNHETFVLSYSFRRAHAHSIQPLFALAGRQRIAPLRYSNEEALSPMFVVVWQFEIAEDKIAAFEAAYGPTGSWAQLFQTSPDYKGTELLRDAFVPGNYLTIDRWASEEAFRAFRKAHDKDYEVLDRACDALTSRETRIGAFSV